MKNKQKTFHFIRIEPVEVMGTIVEWAPPSAKLIGIAQNKQKSFIATRYKDNKVEVHYFDKTFSERLEEYLKLWGVISDNKIIYLENDYTKEKVEQFFTSELKDIIKEGNEKKYSESEVEKSERCKGFNYGIEYLIQIIKSRLK